MEDNSNSFLIKVMAGMLILILALNVFRTESTKKQVARLSETVDTLASRMNALGYPDFSTIAPEVGSSISSAKEISDLSKSISDLQSKVNTIQKTIDRMSTAQRQTSSSRTDNPVSSTPTVSGGSQSSGRVSVSPKIKVEDRYVEKTILPQVTSGPEGTVVVNITIDYGGDVTSARIGGSTTIKDEDVLDKCKEAALKTKFNINTQVSSRHPGTITYTFTAK